MNKLDLAEALIAIADAGSIHQAAKKLHQTDAAISKKLTKLETHLSLQLVNRERKGLTLTEAGQRYYHEAKKALEQFLMAEQCVVQAALQPRGVLKIVSNHYYAERIIVPQLPVFLARYPGLKVNLDIAEILPDFDVKKMDILVGVSAIGKENLVRKQIGHTRYILCASPKYLKKQGTPATTAELLHHDFIAHSARKPINLIILDEHKPIEMNPKLFCNHTSLLIEAALNNLGFIWTHENIVSEFLTSKKLIPFLTRYTQEKKSVYVYYEYQAYPDPKIQAFMKLFFT